jgi:hypothetical protein
MDADSYLDKYEYYEEIYAPAVSQLARRPKARGKPKKSRAQAIAELTDDTTDVDLGFEPTYRPSRYEAGWLLSSLYSFYDEGLITDVLALVKGGKEASVYRCQAHPATGLGASGHRAGHAGRQGIPAAHVSQPAQ